METFCTTTSYSFTMSFTFDVMPSSAASDLCLCLNRNLFGGCWRGILDRQGNWTHHLAIAGRAHRSDEGSHHHVKAHCVC